MLLENKPSMSSGSHFLDPADPLLEFENSLSAQGIFFAAGIDEAGRGCCAGPVVAAAVLFTDRKQIPAGIFDSKQITEQKREEMRQRIIETPGVHYAVAEIHPDEIDRINILRATWKAMAQALQQIAPPAEFALVDGNPVKGLPLPSQNVVKGDARSVSIAAASILAKTHRDHYMLKAAEEYPQYKFEIHKGYCTQLHTELIREHGPCPLHRMTFEPVKSILNPPDMIQGELFCTSLADAVTGGTGGYAEGQQSGT